MIILNQNINIDLFIRGAWFTGTSTVVIPGCTVNTVTVIDDNILQINITTPTIDGFHDVEVTTDEGGTTIFSNAIEVKLSNWTDLRQGGDILNIGTDIRVRTGMNILRDANGMYFSGATTWSSWVKFESLGWQRGENKTLSMIFTRPDNNMMIGIGSDATDETSTSQFAQAENEAYFNSTTNFWGLYGNNGTVGSAGNQANGLNISGGSGVYKIKFEGDGAPGSTFTFYEIPSSSPTDWDDESNILSSFIIGGTLNPDEVNLIPFIIPRDGGAQRFLALKLE